MSTIKHTPEQIRDAADVINSLAFTPEYHRASGVKLFTNTYAQLREIADMLEPKQPKVSVTFSEAGVAVYVETGPNSVTALYAGDFVKDDASEPFRVEKKLYGSPEEYGDTEVIDPYDPFA
ncbi:hypothetical protein CH25_gp37 [Mycobacterium phage EagleEye]|uniref:Uncharacterized protein n=1 Tax=Mycobacterium phage EagleEye TaxID=1429759 RepID=W0LMS7_9CAUD|nr:hypothetical protein CH25_gp37 [Mycobacterium phage EagleEye]AHG23849.1 hypothetical protein PBI_EAGLEEYE_69 [Mycobacterium phage EagleEye]QDK03502.1 hypothetical protein SEA_LUCYEDI_68 [Mycobacterium phage Lucyedi]